LRVLQKWRQIWLGKILANDIQFAKFTKVFPHHNFALYGMDVKMLWPEKALVEKDIKPKLAIKA